MFQDPETQLVMNRIGDDVADLRLRHVDVLQTERETFRLMPLLLQEWQLIRLGRRARGIDAGSNPVAAVALFRSAVFALLVDAIRPGVRLAVALEARGFGSQGGRTHARRMRMRTADWALLAGTALVATVAVAASAALGT